MYCAYFFRRFILGVGTLCGVGGCTVFYSIHPGRPFPPLGQGGVFLIRGRKLAERRASDACLSNLFDVFPPSTALGTSCLAGNNYFSPRWCGEHFGWGHGAAILRASNKRSWTLSYPCPCSTCSRDRLCSDRWHVGGVY